jgi:hypothetical protein
MVTSIDCPRCKAPNCSEEISSFNELISAHTFCKECGYENKLPENIEYKPLGVLIVKGTHNISYSVIKDEDAYLRILSAVPLYTSNEDDLIQMNVYANGSVSKEVLLDGRLHVSDALPLDDYNDINHNA